MDEKTYRSIVQATQADTAENNSNMAATLESHCESVTALESLVALESSTFDRSRSGCVK